MAQLSPTTKSRIHQISMCKKATGRARRMVTAELLKKAEPPPPARKKTPPKGLAASKENGYLSVPAYRPLKRTKAEDHVFCRSRSPETPTGRSVIHENGFVPAAAAGECEPMSLCQDVAPPDSVRELHQRTSPAKEDLPRRSPVRLASVIEWPTAASVIEWPTAASVEESQSPCQSSPNGYPKVSETDGAQTDQRSGQSRIVEEYRMGDSIVACSNRNLHSPPRDQHDQGRAASLQTVGFENLLRRVESPKGGCSASVCFPLSSLPVEQNGDSYPVKLRPGTQNLQRRTASPEYIPPPGYFHGLWNLGNTCYMNTVIQLLFNLECFVADITTPKSRVALPNDGICVALLDVFNSMTRGCVHEVVSPACLQSACEKYMTDFCGREQQDAQEYLLNILDKIEEEITSNQEKQWRELQAVPAIHDRICPTTKNFSCQVRNVLSCEGCDNVVNVEQSSRHFSLPLPEDRRDPHAEVPDIEALLNIYFQVESLSRKCEKCGAETMRSETKIVQLPRVMILHINRFEIDRHMLCSKVSVPVKFSDSLDIGNWCLDDVRGPCEAEEFIVNDRQDVPGGDLRSLADCRENSHAHDYRPTGPEEVRNSAMEVDEMYYRKRSRWGAAVTTNYKLHGVVSHVGKLASCGHYTVDIFDSDSSKYVRCDDAVVREVAPEDVFCEEKSAEAYVLLYILHDN